MAFGFSKSRHSPIAIDFGADNLKLLQVILTEPPQLYAAASATFPAEARRDPAARMKFITEVLPDLLRGGAFKGRRVMCSIPAHQMLIQNMEIARAEKDNLDNVVGLQLQQRLNINPARLVMRSLQVGQIVRDGSHRQEVICLAAGRDVVMQYIQQVERCKYQVVGMHSEPLCLFRAFQHLLAGRQETDRVICFIDIGAASTKVIIMHGTEMVFAKKILAGGDQITMKLAAAKEIDFLKARELRISQAASPKHKAAGAGGEGASLPLSGTCVSDACVSPSQAPKHEIPAASLSADHEMLDCLMEELGLCIRYHQSLFPEKPVDRLIFLGGESQNTQICQSVAKSLRIAAQLGDPFARLSRVNQRAKTIGINVNQPQPGWAVPLGLSLSEANL